MNMKWISVEDELPEETQWPDWIMAYSKMYRDEPFPSRFINLKNYGGYTDVDVFLDLCEVDYDGKYEQAWLVTHWAYRPEAPEEK